MTDCGFRIFPNLEMPCCHCSKMTTGRNETGNFAVCYRCYHNVSHTCLEHRCGEHLTKPQPTPEDKTRKHFVTFLSPGSFVCEETTKEIDGWDITKATKMSKGIVERYNAKPFGFFFTTRERGEKDFDSKQTRQSGRYYLGGRVMTLAEVKKAMPDKTILISNMECNKWKRIIITNSGTAQPLEENDTVLTEL